MDDITRLKAELAAAQAELRIEREASNVWQDHLEVAKQDLAAAQEARQAAEALAESYRKALENIETALRKGGATLPAPEPLGTPESAMKRAREALK